MLVIGEASKLICWGKKDIYYVVIVCFYEPGTSWYLLCNLDWPQTVAHFLHQPLKWNSCVGFSARQKCHNSKRDAKTTFVQAAHFLASRNDCI